MSRAPASIDISLYNIKYTQKLISEAMINNNKIRGFIEAPRRMWDVDRNNCEVRAITKYLKKEELSPRKIIILVNIWDKNCIKYISKSEDKSMLRCELAKVLGDW